jgi:ABC-type enterobactin transport system permease subunit
MASDAHRNEVAVKVSENVWFAALVGAVLLLAASACFAATLGTPHQWLGSVANAVAVGVGGTYLGTTIRRRRRRRRRDDTR